MEDLQSQLDRLNPYVGFVNNGTVYGQPYARVAPDRMCRLYEIALITEAEPGSGVITLDQFLPARQGMIYLWHPGMIVCGVGHYSYQHVIFDACYDPAFRDEYDKRERLITSPVDVEHLRRLKARGGFLDCLDMMPTTCQIRDMNRYSPHFEAIFFNYMEGRSTFQLYARREMYTILTLLMEETSGRTEQAGEEDRLLAVRRFLFEHYSEDITLERLARQAHIGREHLCRMFSRRFAMSPIGYLMNVRLYHARNLLITSDKLISEIVTLCGFSSEQYFYRLFRRRYGMTPHRYRTNYQLNRGRFSV